MDFIPITPVGGGRKTPRCTAVVFLLEHMFQTQWMWYGEQEAEVSAEDVDPAQI